MPYAPYISHPGPGICQRIINYAANKSIDLHYFATLLKLMITMILSSTLKNPHNYINEMSFWCVYVGLNLVWNETVPLVVRNEICCISIHLRRSENEMRFFIYGGNVGRFQTKYGVGCGLWCTVRFCMFLFLF